MRIEHNKPMSHTLRGHPHAKGTVYEFDIKPTKHGRLAAKVLIFENEKRLRAFWRDGLSNDVDKDCFGVVNELGNVVQGFISGGDKPDYTVWRCDPRYFCIVGLCANRLYNEVIYHESVHVGYAYAFRAKLKLEGYPREKLEEETVAYVAGRFGAKLTRKLYKWGLWK